MVVQEIPRALVAEKIQVPFVETQERTQLRTFVPFVAVCHSLERIVEVGVAQTPWRWTSHVLTQTRRASTSTNYDFHDSNCCNYYCYHNKYYYYYCCYWIPLGLKDESCMSLVFVASKTAQHSEMSESHPLLSEAARVSFSCPLHVRILLSSGSDSFHRLCFLVFSLVTSKTALHSEMSKSRSVLVQPCLHILHSRVNERSCDGQRQCWCGPHGTACRTSVLSRYARIIPWFNVSHEEKLLQLLRQLRQPTEKQKKNRKCRQKKKNRKTKRPKGRKTERPKDRKTEKQLTSASAQCTFHSKQRSNQRT